MAQILDPLPNGKKNSILCCYVNATSHIQIVRITNIANWYFERVVFPGQRLVFETLGEAFLEIHTGMMASAILSDNIPCERLYISDGDDDDSDGQLDGEIFYPHSLEESQGAKIDQPVPFGLSLASA